MRQKQRVFSLFLLSPSSRRAWIEISGCKRHKPKKGDVALLTEGVDRNEIYQTLYCAASASPSSRRAWIEIA